MSKVSSAHAVSVDRYITGRGLGDGTTLPAPGATHLHHEIER
jgi:hypothetical protein